jgi:hypothetical protein
VIINELSDLAEIDIQLLPCPPMMLWVHMGWEKGEEVISIPEQSVEDMVLQVETQNAPLAPVFLKEAVDCEEYDRAQINNNFAIMLSGKLEVVRYADEMLGLQEVSFIAVRGETRLVGDSPVPLILDGITSRRALEPSEHSCLSVDDMDEYKYEGKFHTLLAGHELDIIKSDDKTWVFVADGMIMVDDTPYFDGTYLELTENELLTSLDDDTIILVLNRLGKHK